MEGLIKALGGTPPKRKTKRSYGKIVGAINTMIQELHDLVEEKKGHVVEIEQEIVDLQQERLEAALEQTKAEKAVAFFNDLHSIEKLTTADVVTE